MSDMSFHLLISAFNACDYYRDQKISLEGLRQHIWNLHFTLNSVMYRELREFLQISESALETIFCTFDDDKIYDSVMPIVSNIKKHISPYINVMKHKLYDDWPFEEYK